MATTLSNIAQYLDSLEWSYEIDEAKSHIVTGVKAENVERFIIVIQLLQNGEIVKVYTPQLLNIKDHVFKGVLFQAMLGLMWEYSLVRFEYDPKDGNICASIDLLLENTSLSQKQLDYALRVLVEAVDDYAMPRIKEILATGIDPGRKQLAARMLQQMPEEMIDLLAEALRDREKTRYGNSNFITGE